MSLKDKRKKELYYGLPKKRYIYLEEDVKEAISDWKLYVKICNLLTTNRREEADKLITTLTDKYECKWYEVTWDTIWGDFEE